MKLFYFTYIYRSNIGWTAVHYTCNNDPKFLNSVKLIQFVAQCHTAGGKLFYFAYYCRCNIRRTALHYACQKGHVRILKTLLHGAEIDSQDKDGRTPLQLAAYFGKQDICIILVRAGADVNLRDNMQVSPLYVTVQNNYMTIAESLIVNGASNIESFCVAGCTALSTACGTGNLRMVKMLLEYGASVNSTKYNGKAPLCMAALNGHRAIVLLLLHYKATFDKPMHTDRENQMENTNHNNVNNYAPANNSARRRCYCIQDVPQSNGSTPLFQAVMHNHLLSAYILLCRGASVNPTMSYTLSKPLHLAAELNYINIVRLLISYGADIDARDKYKRTALHYAAKRGHIQVVKDLIDVGAVLRQQDVNGKTPIDYATDNGHQSVVTLLQENSREFIVYPF